jgi:hypothetical protein
VCFGKKFITKDLAMAKERYTQAGGSTRSVKVDQEEHAVLVSIDYLIGTPKYNQCGKYSISGCLECPNSFFRVDSRTSL